VAAWIGLACLLVSPAVASAGDAGAIPEVVEFNRDIRPILSDNCYACHGPDKNARKGDLRLDTKEGLLSEDSVVAGKPDDSELYQRLIADDPALRMPAPKTGKSLATRQIALIRRWIEQGAKWEGHWSYIAPRRPKAIPDDPDGASHPIDRLVRARLREAGLHPSAEADRVTLIRRLSFDLVGLPPSKAEVDAFVADRSTDAYERLVDRLLASPHFGERMALGWLDLVRFADTIGYHSDNPMNVAPYRDYVIKSFNENKPFDRFTVEQLAGDLLPGATTEQEVASAYNRLLQTTEEGGAQAKEYEAKYAADRVRNASTVWLAATMGCCECHDHKYDPFTTRDFYSFAAFFADVREAAVGRREPGMPVPDPGRAEALRTLDERIAATKARLDASTPELAGSQGRWEASLGGEVRWQPLGFESVGTDSGTMLERLGDGSLRASGNIAVKEAYRITARSSSKDVTAIRLEILADPKLPANGPGAAENGNFVLSEFRVATAVGDGPIRPLKLGTAVADHSQDGYPIAKAIDGRADTGWAILPQVGKGHEAIFEADGPVGDGDLTTWIVTLDHRSTFPRHNIGRFRLWLTTDPNPSRSLGLPDDVRAILAVAPESRTDAQRGRLAAHYRSVAPELKPLREELARLETQKQALIDAMPKVLVTVAGPPRTMRVLPRGNWLIETGPVVEPAVPAFLATSANGEGRRATRLDLARWLTARENPLPARVVVNRLWKQFFGTGLSKTVDDLGSQGEWPTHPELLDWLAVEFLDRGWDVKHMVRLIVTSETYRQSSRPTAEQKERDPYNRLLARQGRFRLDAELVRDNALAVSGLLVPVVGGPSVKPYQPSGYWDQLNFPTRTYQADRGPSQYRRGLYTHRQRTFPHPSLLAFDAPSREECVADRSRSNIPQQALALLDDPTYVEAARAFAERIVRDGGATVADRLDFAFGRCLSRRPSDAEARLLADLLSKHAAHYAADRDAARKLLAVGDRPAPADIDAAELASWISVARVLLNLHETITRD
jgi:mono/diheme cytochrome c family protein